MKFSNEQKIQISEFLLALFLLLSLVSEYCDGMISNYRHLVITMEQVVLSYQNQLNGSFLKAYDYKFDRVLNISVLPVQDISYLPQKDTFREINESFKDGKMSASKFEEKASDYFTSIYNDLNNKIQGISKNINDIQSDEIGYDLWIKKINFFKYSIIFVVLVIQGNLIRSLGSKENMTKQDKKKFKLKFSEDLMLKVYRCSFLILAIVFVWLTIWWLKTGNLTLMKDFSLPLAALLFTAGNLWHIKENQEFEKEKYLLERKDKYWDKRFKYYFRLHELVGIVNYELMGEDVIPKEDGIAFKDTKLGKVYKTLQELGDEGEILFNNSNISNGANIGLLIKEIGEKLEKVLTNLQTMYEHRPRAHQAGDASRDALLISTYNKNVELREEIEKIYDKCRTEIFSYLKLD